MKKRILVIEDDVDIRDLIRLNLSDFNHQVETVDSGERGLEQARRGQYDAIVLDIMLPEIDGLEICRRLRAEGQTTPILMLTARGTETDRVIGLELGADDYLTKPFSVRELQARVKALLRRANMQSQAEQSATRIFSFEGLSIDPAKRKVTLDGHSIELTSTEFDLLWYLAQHPGLVFSRSQLLSGVWGYQHSGYEHTVNTHINRLRTKLEADPSKPRFVLTVWGVGYKFADA